MTPLGIEPSVRSRRWRTLLRVIFLAPQPRRWRGRGLLLATAAYVLVIARATLLGYAFAIPVAVAFGPEVASGGPGRLYATLAFVVFEELGRLGYAWNSTNKTASLVAFFALTVAVETLAYFRPHYGLAAYLVSRAPSVGVHLLATVALAVAFRRPRFVLPVFAVVLGGHVAFDYWAPSIVTFLTGLDPRPSTPRSRTMK